MIAPPDIGESIWLRPDPRFGDEPAEAVVVGYDGGLVFVSFVDVIAALAYHDRRPCYGQRYTYRTMTFGAMQNARVKGKVA